MRVGIHGEIYGFSEGGLVSYGAGIEVDARRISREEPEVTIKFEASDGAVVWFEAGAEIAAPAWLDRDD